MVNRAVIEVVIGVFYALGAAAQALWVLPNSEEFYRDMADRAWLPPAEAFILIPNTTHRTESTNARYALSYTAFSGPNVDDERRSCARQAVDQPEPNVVGVRSTRTKSLRMSIPTSIISDSTNMARVSATTSSIRRTLGFIERASTRVKLVKAGLQENGA